MRTAGIYHRLNYCVKTIEDLVVAQFVGASLRGRPLIACDVRRPGVHGGTPYKLATEGLIDFEISAALKL
jgi:hypothetical protein